MSADLRSRIAVARRRATQGASSLSLSLFSTPVKGGLGQNPMIPIAPITLGAQLCWVRDASNLCLGCVGTERKICLLDASKCYIGTHQQNKCVIPDQLFLTVITGPDRGSEQIILKTSNLDDELIERMLAETKSMDWAKQFTVLEAGRANSLSEWHDANELIKSVVKHQSFSTPNKKNAATDLAIEIQALTDLSTLLQDLGLPEYNEDGVRTNTVEVNFNEKAYIKLMADVVDKIEILTDVACTVTTILGNQKDSLDFQTRPLEELVEGMRLDFLATKSSVGEKDPSKLDSPANLWIAVESVLESCSSLGNRLSSISNVVEETRGNVDCLLLEMSIEDKGISKDNEQSDPSMNFLNNEQKPHRNTVTPEKIKNLSWADQSEHDCDQKCPDVRTMHG